MENKELHYSEEFVLSTNKNLFLTGKAGTGKTTFLKSVLKKTKKNTIVVAPTGVAAINAGGVTIHSMFQLPTTAFIPTADFTNPSYFTNVSELAKVQKLRREKRSVLMELELLIIDEISMVRADLLDAIDLTLRRIRKNLNPFGGVQLIAIGDLFQLAPVVKEHIWDGLQHYYKSPFFFDSWAWMKSNPISLELQKVYRQADQSFINILNRVRNGIRSDEDLALLNKQLNSKINGEIITLTTHNNKADAINNDQLNKLKSKEIVLEAEITGKFYESSYPTSEKFSLKIGAQVMFIRNHPEGLYFNGKLGKLMGQQDELLQIKLADEDKTILVEKEEWKNSSFSIDEETKEIRKEDIGTFKQYPIRLAWAVTVHKSQGLTFDKLQLDLEKSFAAGQLYVALSRCRSLQGLKLLTKIKPENIIVDNRISNFYNIINEPFDVAQELEQSKLAYEIFLMKKSFDFNKYDAILESFKSYVIESDVEKSADIIMVVDELLTEMKSLISTGERFQLQLDSLFAENQEDQLIERSEMAIRYFTDELNSKIILPLESHIDKFRSIKIMRKYTKEAQSLCDEFWFLMRRIYAVEYRNKKVHIGPEKYKRDVLFTTIKKKKKEKGETYKITLDLFKKGKSLEQIADLRLLAKSTIATHMTKHLKSGSIDILELMKKNRYEKIRKFVERNKEKTTSEVVKEIGFQIEFSEVSWIRAVMEYEAGDKE